MTTDSLLIVIVAIAFLVTLGTPLLVFGPEPIALVMSTFGPGNLYTWTDAAAIDSLPLQRLRDQLRHLKENPV